MSDTIKYVLAEKQMPQTWYNIVPHLPVPMPPPLHPGTHSPSVRRTSRRSSRWR